jgi:SpoVK/Ycf46/Vps4 family AAA+-type ATPase
MHKINTIEHIQSKLDQMIPVIYILSEDEHRAIQGIKQMTQKSTNKYASEIFVYKSTTGIRSCADYEREFSDKACLMDDKTGEINNALIHIYKANPKDRRQIYIITDADRHLDDNQVIRRVKDFAVQADNNDGNLKIIVLLSSKLFLPDKLEKYIDIVTYPYPSTDEIKVIIENWLEKCNQAAKKKQGKQVEIRTDFEIINALRGLITPQINQALAACINITKKTDKNPRLDASILNKLKREAINKTSTLTFREPKISFKDVGGLGRLKKWMTIMQGGWTNEGQAFGLPPVKGALLLGLPGNGKTRICEAQAYEWGINFIEFDPSKVFSSRVGESEGNMYLTLARVDSMAPCVLFIDEIEKGFAGMQSSSMSDAGTTARTISIFLMWMNNEESYVFVSATCNNVNFLPPELISRFDEIFYIAPPNVTEREEILKILIDAQKRDSSTFDISKLAQASNYLSGREIRQAITEAMYVAFRQNQKDKKTNLNDSILSDCLRRKTPIVKTMEKQLEYLIKWVGYDKERNDGVRARFANNEMDSIDALFAEILEKSDNAPENQQSDFDPSKL